MNRRQIQKAAKIFAYSMAATIDAGRPGTESEEQDHVIEATNAWGKAKLARMGITSPLFLGTLQDCIKAASAAH